MIDIEILTNKELTRLFKLETIKHYGEIEGEECLSEYYMLTGKVTDDVDEAQRYINALCDEQED